MDIRKLAEEVQGYVVGIRRELHRFPEPSEQEFETTRRVAGELGAIGIPCRRFEPTGLMADIAGDKPGGMVALRADMDALSLTERSGVEFSSQNEGFMHACGHDAHTAMLLGAGKILWGLREYFAGTVRLIFQPAEETAAGARAILSQGAGDNVDAFFGLHVFPFLKAGAVLSRPGAFMAASDAVRITVTGKACHGASPNHGVDATVVAAEIIMALQTIISRRMHPLEPAVFTIGKINSGTRFNIVSGCAEMGGTTRFFNEDMRPLIQKLAREIIEGVAVAHGAAAQVEFAPFTNVVSNDKKMHDIAMAAAGKIALGSAPVGECGQSMGSEDFCEYSKLAPGVFVQLGTGGEYPIHSDRFTVDEDAFITGTALHVQVALDTLGELKIRGISNKANA